MAVSFRDQLQIDLATMMEQSVFGLTVELDGEALECAEVNEDGAPFKRNEDIPGLNTVKRSLIFRTSQMSSQPTVGQQVDIDGEYWYVTQVKRPLGHFIVDFSRGDS